MTTTSPLPPRISAAVTALKEGKPVIVLDDEGRENEADVIAAAQTMTEEWLAWTIRHSSGVICVPLTEERADALRLPFMVRNSEDPFRTAYTVSVDASSDITTGISAADRLKTIRVLDDPSARAEDLQRPGHVFPLRAKDGGVLTRRGHTEAAVDLCRLAGLSEVGVISELVHDHGPVMRADAADELAKKYDLPIVTIDEMANYLADLTSKQNGVTDAADPAALSPHSTPRITLIAHASLPTAHGPFTLYGYRDEATGVEHAALVAEHESAEPVVRVHSECLTGDALSSLRCDCGPQLNQAMRVVSERGGAIVYLGGHEGRGIGLTQKIAAYALQDGGLDTVDANVELGLPVDSREFSASAAILHNLGLTNITLLTNNPEKVTALENYGVTVTKRESLYVGVSAHNEKYLRSKAERLGHTYEQPVEGVLP